MSSSSASMSERSGRIELIDFVRGLAVVSMIVYHFAYDLEMFGVTPRGTAYSTPMYLFERAIASTFIFVAGFSSRLSRSNLRRGALVFACGLAVALCSGFVGVTIRFGVLELLGASMMIYGVLKKPLDRFSPAAVSAACIPVFCAGYYVYRNVHISAGWLYPLGLRGWGFYSADYFPLWPWFFLFLTGAQLARALLELREPGEWTRRRFPGPVSFIGRHSLVIYMAHQLVLYPAAWAISLAAS